MLARELISRSYYTSGIVSREGETVAGQQIIDALDLLNDITAEKSANAIGIPYSTHLDLPLIQGQEDYFVEGLIESQAVTFELQGVRYTMVESSRKEYFVETRPAGVESLPYSYYSERELDGTRLYFYFLPIANITAEITGRFSLPEVLLTTDMSVVFDRFYVSYLKYELAFRICGLMGYPYSPQNEATRAKLEKKINKVTGVDTTVNKTSSFPINGSLNWADVNIGRGFRPPR